MFPHQRSTFSPVGEAIAKSVMPSSPDAKSKYSKYEKQLYLQISRPENSPLYCKNCKSKRAIVEDHMNGHLVCTLCGLCIMNHLIIPEEGKCCDHITIDHS